MNHVRRTFGFSAVLALSFVVGATQGAVGATYPPAPGTGFGLLPTTIILSVPPLVPGSAVAIPRAPGSKEVFTLRPVLATESTLGDLLTQLKPHPVLVTRDLILGGIGRDEKNVPKVIVRFRPDEPVEIQTKVDVPLSIALHGFKPYEAVTITVIENGKKVVLGTFKVGADGVFILPAATVVGGSAVKFSLKRNEGTETIVLRPVVSKSKFSTAKVSVQGVLAPKKV